MELKNSGFVLKVGFVVVGSGILLGLVIMFIIIIAFLVALGTALFGLVLLIIAFIIIIAAFGPLQLVYYSISRLNYSVFIEYFKIDKA